MENMFRLLLRHVSAWMRFSRASRVRAVGPVSHSTGHPHHRASVPCHAVRLVSEDVREGRKGRQVQMILVLIGLIIFWWFPSIRTCLRQLAIGTDPDESCFMPADRIMCFVLCTTRLLICCDLYGHIPSGIVIVYTFINTGYSFFFSLSKRIVIDNTFVTEIN